MQSGPVHGASGGTEHAGWLRAGGMSAAAANIHVPNHLPASPRRRPAQRLARVLPASRDILSAASWNTFSGCLDQWQFETTTYIRVLTPALSLAAFLHYIVVVSDSGGPVPDRLNCSHTRSLVHTRAWVSVAETRTSCCNLQEVDVVSEVMNWSSQQ